MCVYKSPEQKNMKGGGGARVADEAQKRQRCDKRGQRQMFKTRFVKRKKKDLGNVNKLTQNIGKEGKILQKKGIRCM
jgi:hypothetical protein